MPATNPLEQLKDIHLPQAIGFWPPALGWWLVAALFIVILITGLVLYRLRRKKAYRRAAIQQINKLFDDYQPQQSHQFTGQLNTLLKTVALHHYDTEQVSRLTQNQWLEFLDNSANMQDFSYGAGQILATAPYDKNSELTNPAALKQCCITWIRRHR